MKTVPSPLRQGDVLLIPVTEAALGAKLAREKGAVVLAHGEVTGHSHAIRSNGATLFAGKAANDERFLRVVRPVDLLHEEHSPVRIDPGLYRVLVQSEYTPEELRRVAD